MANLAESLKTQGVIQPLVVRSLLPDDPRRTSGAQYEILAGERRWRAAQMAKIMDIPIIVRDIDDSGALAIGLVENIQRQDLDAIEEAQALQKLIDEFGYTQDEVAEAVGRSRSAVANTLRLLTLPDGVQTWVRNGQLGAGHVRTLIGLPDKIAQSWAQEAVNKNLSVRALESLVRSRKQTKTDDKQENTSTAQNADVRRFADDLSEYLGMRVVVKHRGKRGGTLTLHYRHLDQLDSAVAKLMSKNDG